VRTVLIVAAAAATAGAETPRMIRLEPGRTRLLDGRATVRLAEAMLVVGADTAVLDWGATRFTLVAEQRPALAEDREESIVCDLGRAAGVEHVPLVRNGLGYGAAPVMPRLASDRALVYLACRTAPDGVIGVLRFYVSAAGVDEVSDWAVLARAIAATLDVRPDRSPPLDPPPVPRERLPPALPRGWRVWWEGSHQHVESPHGVCDVHDSELDARAAAPEAASHVHGELRGNDVYWSVWSDRTGQHAETMVGAAHRGQVHVQRRAATATELSRQRTAIERLWR
jgi:hypothetical protein